MENEQHNKYIGYIFIANFLVQMFFSLLMVLFFSMFFFIEPGPGQPPFPAGFFFLMFTVVFASQLIFTLPSLIAGWAILKKKPWARVAAFVGAAMSAMNVPVGTAACVYALWFFAGEEWKQVYEPENYRPRVGELPPDMQSYRQQNESGSGSENEPIPRQSDWR